MKNLALTDGGFTLTEIIVATAVLSITSLAVFTLISLVNSRSSYILALQTRDALQIEIMRNLEDEKAVAKTRSLSTIFNNCFRLAKSERGCPGQKEIGISFFSSSGQRIGGPPTAPVFYTIAGTPCNNVQSQGANTRCPIQVTTTVRAQGIPVFWSKQLVTSGNVYHELVEVRYIVKILDNVLVPSNQRLLSGSYVYDTQDQMNAMPTD